MQNQIVNGAEQQNTDVIASVRGLNKTFNKKSALTQIDLDINGGQVVAILGANGAGKTTLINILLGRLALDSGAVSVFGQKPGASQVRRQTGTLLQVANLPETLRIKEHIQLFQSYYPEPMDYQKVIKYAGLESMQDRFSKKLSGGEKQRLLFALAICGNPKLLFLDEPSVGMDIQSRQNLWKAIRDLKAQGTAIVLTTHYLEEADSLADQIVLLKEGKIVAEGTNQEIKAKMSGSVIQFISPESPIDFSQCSGVTLIEKVGRYTSIQTDDVNSTLTSILSLFADLQGLTVENAGLEQAFLHFNQTTEQQESSYE
jgi:ABC-2 type transport system ATP-binding protein